MISLRHQLGGKSIVVKLKPERCFEKVQAQVF